MKKTITIRRATHGRACEMETHKFANQVSNNANWGYTWTHSPEAIIKQVCILYMEFNKSRDRVTPRMLPVMSMIGLYFTWNDLMKVHRRVRMPSPLFSNLTSLITRKRRKKEIEKAPPSSGFCEEDDCISTQTRGCHLSAWSERWQCREDGRSHWRRVILLLPSPVDQTKGCFL